MVPHFIKAFLVTYKVVPFLCVYRQLEIDHLKIDLGNDSQRDASVAIIILIVPYGDDCIKGSLR